MTDIRVRSNFPGHRKTLRLVHRCGHDAPFKLLSLWCYAAEYRKDGWLTDLSLEDLELEARWTSGPNQFVKALLQIGWMDLYQSKRNFDSNPEQTTEARIRINDVAFESGKWLDIVKGGVLYLHDWHMHNPYLASHQKRSEIAKRNVEKRWGKDTGSAGGNGNTGSAGDVADTGDTGQLPLEDTGMAGAGGNGNHTNGGQKTESKPKTNTNGIPTVSTTDTNRTKNDTPIPFPIPIPNPNNTSDPNNKDLQERNTYSPADAGPYWGNGYGYGKGKAVIPNTPDTDAVITHFNHVTGKNYELTGQKSLRAVFDLLQRGETVETLQLVATYMARKWMNDKNRDYLRPQTVYGENYESYREAALAAEREQINHLVDVCKKKPCAIGESKLRAAGISPADYRVGVSAYYENVKKAAAQHDYAALKQYAALNLLEYIKVNQCRTN